MTTTVEVQQRRLRSGSSVIALGLGVTNSLDRRVETVDIGLVVLRVVQLHDLTRDVRLESTVVVCVSSASVGIKGRVGAYKGGRGEWPCRGQRSC